MDSKCFFDDTEVVFVVDGQNENVGEIKLAVCNFLFKLFLAPSDNLKTVLQNLSVGDTEVVDPGFFGGECKVFGGCGGFRGIGEDGKLSVFLQDSVIDFREGGIAFLAQFGEEFFDVHTVFLEFFLNQLSALDQDGWGSADEAFQGVAFYKKEGDEKFDGEEKDDGGDCVEQGDTLVENGGCGNLGKHDGDDEFGNLDFADLTFAHETHGDDQGEIEDYGADDDGCHGDSMRGCGGKYNEMREFQKENENPKKVENFLKKVLTSGGGSDIITGLSTRRRHRRHRQAGLKKTSKKFEKPLDKRNRM